MTRQDPESPTTNLIFRLNALIGVLRAGPLGYPELVAQLQDAYPATASARRMINRDIGYLRALGISITRSATRPPIYTLQGGTPNLSDDDIRVLALVRDTFSARHPQQSQVHRLLERLTADLSDDQQRDYHRRPALRAPVEPAIDYSDFAPLFDILNSAITTRRRLSFSYRALRAARPTRHERVEPLEIEFHDRHFYLAAYTPRIHQVLDFRIDRIQYDETFQQLDRLPAEMLHERQLLTFRYRLSADVARGGVSERFERQRIIEELANGDVIIEAQGRSDFFIIQTLLRYRANAEVLEPPELRAKMVEEIERLWRVYQ